MQGSLADVRGSFDDMQGSFHDGTIVRRVSAMPFVNASTYEHTYAGLFCGHAGLFSHTHTGVFLLWLGQICRCDSCLTHTRLCCGYIGLFCGKCRALLRNMKGSFPEHVGLFSGTYRALFIVEPLSDASQPCLLSMYQHMNTHMQGSFADMQGSFAEHAGIFSHTHTRLLVLQLGQSLPLR